MITETYQLLLDSAGRVHCGELWSWVESVRGRTKSESGEI